MKFILCKQPDLQYNHRRLYEIKDCSLSSKDEQDYLISAIDKKEAYLYWRRHNHWIDEPAVEIEEITIPILVTNGLHTKLMYPQELTKNHYGMTAVNIWGTALYSIFDYLELHHLF